jgi:hypothetical protein
MLTGKGPFAIERNRIPAFIISFIGFLFYLRKLFCILFVAQLLLAFARIMLDFLRSFFEPIPLPVENILL